MTHDKFCPTSLTNPNGPEWFYACKCLEIETIRADEREQAAQRVQEALNNSPEATCGTNTNAFDDGYSIAQTIAVRTIRGGEQV